MYNDGVSGAPSSTPLQLGEQYNRQAAARAVGPLGVTLSTSPQALALRVLLQNVRYKNTIDKGWRHWAPRSNALAAIVGGVDPDIMAFQEVLPSQHADLTVYFPGYGSTFREREPGGEGVPIFWRTATFALISAQTRWLSDSPNRAGSRTWGNAVPRICTSARLRHKPSGRVVTVFNAHYDDKADNNGVRLASSNLIAGWMRDALAEGPVLLAGDLNVRGPQDAAVRALLSGVPGLVDTLSVADPEAGAAGTFHRFTGKPLPGMGRVDFIFAAAKGGGARVQRAWIQGKKGLGILPSDHFGLVADVEL
jgi:endonuclease/exonuclease/phosphatase family metal-dependent hydrolase